MKAVSTAKRRFIEGPPSGDKRARSSPEVNGISPDVPIRVTLMRDMNMDAPDVEGAVWRSDLK
jgi:hypothetical protein